MATLKINNLTSVDQPIRDVGVAIPGLGSDSFTSPPIIRALAVSADLRALVTAAVLSLEDGAGNPLTLDNLINIYWAVAGMPGGPPQGVQRVIVAGTTAIPAASKIDLVTFVHNPGERLMILGFVVDDIAGVAFAEDRVGLIVGGLANGVGYFFERTANVGEAKAWATNSHPSLTRTLDWLVFGIVPS